MWSNDSDSVRISELGPVAPMRWESAPESMAAAVRALPEVSGSWGTGHLLHGTLFSVLVTDDGHVAAGAVAPERLYAALATK